MLRLGTESEMIQLGSAERSYGLSKMGRSVASSAPVSRTTSIGGLNGRWNITHAFASTMESLAESFQGD
ncbi:MAG: hypothetical protein CMM00_16535 [Rhodopirellula sp.]|nr:hypothetical protein [Rhodopirellula sp.]